MGAGVGEEDEGHGGKGVGGAGGKGDGRAQRVERFNGCLFGLGIGDCGEGSFIEC